jgi:hypothetical protein
VVVLCVLSMLDCISIALVLAGGFGHQRASYKLVIMHIVAIRVLTGFEHPKMSR